MLVSFNRLSNYVILYYSDKSVLFVSVEDFDRAFAAIITSSKEDVQRDFGLDFGI